MEDGQRGREPVQERLASHRANLSAAEEPGEGIRSEQLGDEARFAGATMGVEPESVILRDRSGLAQFQILEQGYRNDPVSQGLLLDLFEGRTIEFQVLRGEQLLIVPGRIVRPADALELCIDTGGRACHRCGWSCASCSTPAPGCGCWSPSVC